MSEPGRLGALIEGFLGKFRAFVAKRTRPSEVDDVIQETLANLVAADSLGRIDQVAAWLYRAARNEIIDRSRKSKESQLPLWDEADSEFSEISDIMWGSSEDPEDELLKSLFWDELAAALEEMPIELREVFVKTELYAMTFKQLSQESGLPVSALLARKRRAILKLRSRLQDVYELILNP